MSATPIQNQRSSPSCAEDTLSSGKTDGGAHCAGATGSVPPLWAVEAGCLIINTYLHGYHGSDMNENDVADIITRCYLAAQNNPVSDDAKRRSL